MLTLQLEEYFYPHIMVKADPEFKGKQEFSGKLALKTKLTPISREERRWEVSLRITTVPQDHPTPYKFELETVGNFKVSPDFPEEEIESLVRIAGSSTLYSAAREFLLIITGRGPFGVVSLPSITFQEKRKKTKEDKVQPGSEESAKAQ